MIQDISPHIYHNEYKNLSPKDQDFILIFQGNTVLVRFQDDKLRYPTFSEVRNFSLGYHYLFSIDEYQYFLAYALSDNTSASPLCLPGYTYENEDGQDVTVSAVGATVKQYKQYALALQDLKNGRIDAILMDKIPAELMLK